MISTNFKVVQHFQSLTSRRHSNLTQNLKFKVTQSRRSGVYFEPTIEHYSAVVNVNQKHDGSLMIHHPQSGNLHCPTGNFPSLLLGILCFMQLPFVGLLPSPFVRSLVDRRLLDFGDVEESRSRRNIKRRLLPFAIRHKKKFRWSLCKRENHKPLRD